MNIPLVSVCIPCHNAAPFVAAALDSVLSQSWTSLEVIVVDDGSTDGSSEILATYAEKGVHVITERCGSAAKARNRALAAATGDYIKFFDADDLLSSSHIELQVKRLAGRTDVVASSEWGRFYRNDLASFRSNPESVWRDMAATDWLVEAWYNARPMTQPGMFLLPRALVESSGGWDETPSPIDDFEFFARIFCHTKEIFFTPGATLFYRSGLSGSLSGQKSQMAVESAFHSLIRGTGHLLQRRDDCLARRSCANILQNFIYTYYPDHSGLRKSMNLRIAELGGSDLPPDGPPNFQHLRRVVGWRIARLIQRVRS